MFGVIRVLLPVLYCGGLIYYFLDQAGSVEEAESFGLSSTLLGLGVVGLLFSILLIVRIVRMFAGPPSPGSGRHDGPDAPTPDDEGGFDADAAIARYMASRSPDPAAPLAHGGGGPARPPSFGRRTR